MKHSHIFHKTTATALLLCALPMALQASDFPDTQNHWAENGGHIDKALALGGITGYPDGTFQPDQEVTGYELMTMIASSFFSDRVALQIALDNSGNGIDTLQQNIDTWAIKYAYALFGHGDFGGITLFTDNTAMKGAINRYTASKIIMYALESKGITSYPVDYSTPLGDFPEVKTVAYHGIMGGKTGGDFDGTGSLTRAEATVILGNMSELAEIYLQEVGDKTLIIPTGTVGEYPDVSLLPEIDVTPETDANPETDTTPETDVTPETDTTPETDATPETDVTPETDTTPETDVTPETEDDTQLALNILYGTEVCRLLNIERVALGLTPVTLDTDLSASAQFKAEDMALNQDLSHTSPTYGGLANIITLFGIKCTVASENIAYGYHDGDAVFTGWMGSTGHKDNMFKDNITKMGIGYADGYWAQQFTD